MRVRKGSSPKGSWGTTQERAEAFRRTHKVGQKVHGRLIRWQGPGLAWVNIGNQPLLAQISSRPAPGARLSFTILKLKPEIILKEIFEGSQACIPIYDLVKEFNKLRNDFETASHALWQDFPTLKSTDDKRSHFHEILDLSKEPAAAFHTVTACAARINALLSQQEVFFYWPWLQPGGRNQAGLVRYKDGMNASDPFIELIYEFESPFFGLTQIRTLYKHPKAGYRILAQHLPHKVSIKAHLDALPFPEDVEANCIGLERLPASNHGGILSELLLPSR